jgi:hypothetical protein
MNDELRVGILPRVAFFFKTGVSLAVELTKPEANAHRDL